MNALAPDPRIAEFRAVFSHQTTVGEITKALPPHVKPEQFMRVLTTSVVNDNKLLKYNPRLVVREALKLAALGLLTDPHLGEGYIIPSSSGPQARIGYRGLIKMIRLSGEISSIYAHAVYENDVFEAHLGTEPRVIHQPCWGPRGEVIGFYAVAHFKDGSVDWEPMDVAEVQRIRDKYSDGYRAARSSGKSTPWIGEFVEQGRKTVLKRFGKRLPLSGLAIEAVKLDQELEGDAPTEPVPPIDITPEQPQPTKDPFQQAAEGTPPQLPTPAEEELPPHMTEAPPLDGQVIEPAPAEVTNAQ